MSNWLNRGTTKGLSASMSLRPSSSYDSYDYDYPMGNRIDQFGSPNGHGYCEEDQVSLGLLVVAIGGIGLMWYALHNKIVENKGRRRRATDVAINILEYFIGDEGRFFKCFL